MPWVTLMFLPNESSSPSELFTQGRGSGCLVGRKNLHILPKFPPFMPQTPKPHGQRGKLGLTQDTRVTTQTFLQLYCLRPKDTDLKTTTTKSARTTKNLPFKQFYSSPVFIQEVFEKCDSSANKVVQFQRFGIVMV